jgi:hypothetical protein
MKALRCLAIGVALLAIAGCANFKFVPGDKSVAVGNGVSVTPQIAWAEAPSPNLSGTVWTNDGVELDALMFFTGVAPGKPLIKPDAVAAKELHLYQTGMVPDDVMELLSSNFSHIGYQQIKTANLRPAAFGSAPGFRFDLDFFTQDGLKMKGEALAAQRADKLDLILYIAPAEYYYGRYSDTVDKIFASLKTDK